MYQPKKTLKAFESYTKAPIWALSFIKRETRVLSLMSLRFLICKMELANTLYHRRLRRRLLLLSVKIRLLPCFLCPLGMTCTTVYPVLCFRIYVLSLTSLLLSSFSSNPSIWPVAPHTHLSQPLTSLSPLYVPYVFLSTDPWLLPKLL